MLFYPEGLAPSAPSSKTLVSPVTCRAGRRSVVSEPTSSAASRFCSSALQHSNTRPKPDHQKKNEDDRFFDDHLKTRSKQKAKKKTEKRTFGGDVLDQVGALAEQRHEGALETRQPRLQLGSPRALADQRQQPNGGRLDSI